MCSVADDGLQVRPESMKLKELECTCGREGGVIETGENLD